MAMGASRTAWASFCMATAGGGAVASAAPCSGAAGGDDGASALRDPASEQGIVFKIHLHAQCAAPIANVAQLQANDSAQYSLAQVRQMPMTGNYWRREAICVDAEAALGVRKRASAFGCCTGDVAMPLHPGDQQHGSKTATPAPGPPT